MSKHITKDMLKTYNNIEIIKKEAKQRKRERERNEKLKIKIY